MTHMPRGSREIPMLSRQELPIAVSGLVDSEMAKVSNNGLMAHAMKVNGKIIEHMVKVNSLILTEMSMRETGSMTRLMVMVSIIILMEQCMKVTGEKIFSMELEKKAGPTAPFTKENTLPERNMVSDYTAGMTDLSIKENGMRIRLGDSEHTAG